MDHHQQTRTAQRSRASLIVLIVLAFLLMAAAIVLVISLPDNPAPELPTETTVLTGPEAGFVCDESEAQRLYPFGASVIRLDSNLVSSLDIDGTVLFSADTEMTSPAAISNDSCFLVFDRGGTAFVLLDDRGVVCRGSADGRISGAGLGKDGHFALIIDESGGTGVISVYSPQTGKKMFDCYNPESGYPLAVAFPETGDCFDAVLVNTSGSVMRPVIKRYSIDGSQIGQRLPDLYDLMPMIVYDQDGLPVLCGSATLAALAFDRDDIVWQAGFRQVLSVASLPEGILVLASQKQDGKCLLSCLKTDGAVRFSVPAGDMPVSLAAGNGFAAFGESTRVVVVDCSDGSVALDAELGSVIIRVGFSGPRSVTVVSRDGVRRLNIPE